MQAGLFFGDQNRPFRMQHQAEEPHASDWGNDGSQIYEPTLPELGVTFILFFNIVIDKINNSGRRISK